MKKLFTPSFTDEGHHWYGWPGAFCLKCLMEDPMEIAMADGHIVVDDSDCDNELQFRDDETRERLRLASVCDVKGVLVYKENESGWDLRKPDGTLMPHTRPRKV